MIIYDTTSDSSSSSKSLSWSGGAQVIPDSESQSLQAECVTACQWGIPTISQKAQGMAQVGSAVCHHDDPKLFLITPEPRSATWLQKGRQWLQTSKLWTPTRAVIMSGVNYGSLSAKFITPPGPKCCWVLETGNCQCLCLCQWWLSSILLLLLRILKHSVKDLQSVYECVSWNHCCICVSPFRYMQYYAHI